MQKEQILIAVKTYPTLSKKYAELVCTAGFREDGSWIRLYPSPFRFLADDKRYKKYQWIELLIEKNPADPRPESYRPCNIDDIKLLGEPISTDRCWEERRKLILSQNTIHTNLQTIIAAANNDEYSFAIFKPKKIEKLKVEEVEREWELTKAQAAEAAIKQGSLLEKDDRADFKLVRKLPYKFSYSFLDDEDKKSTLMIEDWEIGQLYWNCLNATNNEKEAIEKVKQKYFNDFALTKDLYLFLGTTRQYHGRAPNPYVIIGTFHPPYISQNSLF